MLTFGDCISSTGKPGVKHESLSLAVERLGGGKVVDVVASQGHCLNAKKTRKLRHTLAGSHLSGTEQLLRTVKDMRANNAHPMVFFSVDNKDFLCPGTANGNSEHFLTVQAYIVMVDGTEEGGGRPCEPRLNAKLQRKAPSPNDVEVTHYTASKMVPPELNTPCDMAAPDVEGVAAQDGRAWAAASRFSHEEGGVDFKTFATRACEDHGSTRDLIFTLPALDFPPRSSAGTDAIISTVLDLLKQLNQDSCMLFCDGVEYADLALKVHSNDEVGRQIFLALGGFHLCQAVMGSLGTVFKSAGLQSVVEDSGVLGEATCKQAFSCRHWDRAFRLNTLLYEVLCGDLYQRWVETIEDEGWKAKLDALQTMLSSTRSEDVRKALDSDDMSRFHTEFCAFVDGRKSESGTFRFYAEYLDAVGELLHYIKVSRDFESHGLESYIQAMEAFLPLLNSADRMLYRRMLAIHCEQLKRMRMTHPELEAVLRKGVGMCIRRNGQKFGAVWPDLCHEQGVNKAAAACLWRVPGDVGARESFFRSYSAITNIVHSLEKLSSARLRVSRAERRRPRSQTKGKQSREGGRPQRGPRKRAKQDVTDLNRLQECFVKHGHPFDVHEGPDALFHLTSKVEATEAIAASMLGWRQAGQEAATAFQKVLCTEDRSRPFTEPLSKVGLETFEGRAVRATSTKDKRDVIYLTSAASCFLKLILLNDAREEKITIGELAQYELAPLPFSLCNPMGEPHSTQKHKLLHKVLTEDTVVVGAESAPEQTALVVDLMKVVQTSVVKKGTMKTFGDLVRRIVNACFKYAKDHRCSRVYLVSDVYQEEPTIKNGCHRQRAGQAQHDKLHGLNMDMPLPAPRKLAQGFLRVASNKTLLLQLLLDSFSAAAGQSDKDVHLMIGDRGWHWDKRQQLQACPELNCAEFDEADQRMIVAIRHFGAAYPRGGSVIVLTEDTDVCVALTSFHERLLPPSHKLYVLRGGSNLRLHDVRKAARVIDEKGGDGVHSLLLPMHVLTGCDTTSGFHGRSKVKAFDCLMNMNKGDTGVAQRVTDALSSTGKEEHVSVTEESSHAELSASFVDGAEQFVCKLYGRDVKTVNEAREQLWVAERPNPAKLPPTHHTLGLHLLRVFFQMIIWTRALRYSSDPGEYEPMTHTPQQFGWDDNCDPVWTEKDAAPSALLEAVHCKSCKTGCTTRLCKCVKNGMKCSKLCTCQGCHNQHVSVSAGLEEDIREELLAVTTVDDGALVEGEEEPGAKEDGDADMGSEKGGEDTESEPEDDGNEADVSGEEDDGQMWM